MYDGHVFLDFEMNPIDREFKEQRELARSEIIEIGAVRLDREYHLVDRYSAYVRPEYGGVRESITRLTGITDAKLENAPLLAAALADFAGWAGPGRLRVYSWSLSDLYQLDDECYMKGITPPAVLMGRWMDFQAVYTRLIGLSSSNRISLSNAVGASESRFSGAAHRAVDDAENSASLLMMVKHGEFSERTSAVRDVLQGPRGGATIGSELGDMLAAFLADCPPDGEA